MNNNTTLNLKIDSYFINILASPDVSTRYTTGGPITKTIKHIGLTKHHQRIEERTWHMVNSCQDMGIKYTRKNVTKHFGRTYLLNNLDELNILADVMRKRLGLRYTTHLINCHCHHKGFNAVFKSTVNLAFFKL